MANLDINLIEYGSPFNFLDSPMLQLSEFHLPEAINSSKRVLLKVALIRLGYLRRPYEVMARLVALDLTNSFPNSGSLRVLQALVKKESPSTPCS